MLTRLSRLPKGRLVELVVESSARGPGEHFVRFRLEGVASGPKPGTYLRLPKLAKRELDEVLGEYRRAHSVALEKPWRFSWRGQRSVGGQRTPIEVYVYDERFRVDIGAGSARVSLRYDGRRLVRLGGDGGLFEFEDDDELVAARIPATRARFALARARLKRSAKALELEGGALSLGRRCFKLAVRDAEDRYVALYIGERRGRLLGLLRPSDDGDRFVETAYLDLEAQSGVMRPRRIERRDWASGRLLSVDRIEAYGAEVADLAFYQAVGGEALEESRERR